MEKKTRKTSERQDLATETRAEAPAGAGWFLIVIVGLFGVAIILGLLTQ